MTDALTSRMQWYQATALFSVMFALVGFSYNVWRTEVSEANSNMRDASFEILLQLAELEQLVYAAHYDDDLEAGNPRVGWVKVGLIRDLSVACTEPVQEQARGLHSIWGMSWEKLPTDRAAADAVVAAIDATRVSVSDVLRQLE
ncbi:MAG: hypothetical protein AAGA91_18485 [Pseudomonadota bacterium]